jgi:hypothetical protein
VPWCPECDRFLSPASVLTDGSCPRCGRVVDPGHAHAPATTDPPGGDDGEPQPATDEEPLDPIPWHFKLLLGAVALYLGYRAFQGIEWLAGL